jgi:hypothetical protein
MKYLRGSRGASVLEVAVVLMIVGIAASALGTGLYSVTENARREAVLSQLDRVKKGLVGESRIIPPGEKDLRRYGFIGDMGVLPPSASLSPLITIGTYPGYSIDSDLQMGTGWRGPYEPVSPSDVSIDPWGRGIVYTVAAGTSSFTGAPIVATVRSLGPDGVQGNPGDDAILEIYKADAFSKVMGYVKDPLAATVAGIQVTLFTPINGVIQSFTSTTDDNGLYSFDDVPQGERVLQLTPKLSFVRDTALTSGTNLNDVEFTVENLGKDSTTVSTMKLTFTTSPAADFTSVLVNGASVFTGTAASGGTVTFSSSKTATGTGVLQEPIHFFEASGLIMLVPDAVIGTIGTGGTLKIQVQNFEQVGTNTDVDMTGVTFLAEFSDGSKTLLTTKRTP